MSFVRQLSLKNGYCSRCCRLYSSRAKVGEKFRSKKEVMEYLGQQTWSVDEYLADSTSEELPSEADVRKLLKLSGLPVDGNDLERIRVRLGKQLSFIDKLHRIPIEDEKTIDECQARLMPRNEVPISYDSLLQKIATQKKDPELGEVEGSWDSTSLAQMKENKYFVVRGGLMHNID